MPARITTSALAFAFASLLMSFGTHAQDASPSHDMAAKARQRFNDADLDHDGFLSREEAKKGTPRLAEHFDEIDTDHDGKLSPVEIVTYFKQHRGSR